MKKSKRTLLLCLLTLAALATLSCRRIYGPSNPEDDPDYDPNQISAFIVTYETEMGETPAQIALAKGATVKSKHLPKLKLATGYYDFDGWYLEGTKIKADEYKIESNITLTAKWNFNHYDYTKTDYSSIVVDPSKNGRTDIVAENGYTKITLPSKKSTNWILASYDDAGIARQLTNVCGFEFKVKVDSATDWGGIQWYNIYGYNCYMVGICGDGSFRVQSNIDGNGTNHINIPAENSHVNQNDYNVVKVVSTRNSDYEFYVNGTKVGEIPRDELLITPGQIGFAGRSKKGTAHVWLKLLNYQQVK